MKKLLLLIACSALCLCAASADNANVHRTKQLAPAGAKGWYNLHKQDFETGTLWPWLIHHVSGPAGWFLYTRNLPPYLVDQTLLCYTDGLDETIDSVISPSFSTDSAMQFRIRFGASINAHFSLGARVCLGTTWLPWQELASYSQPPTPGWQYASLSSTADSLQISFCYHDWHTGGVFIDNITVEGYRELARDVAVASIDSPGSNRYSLEPMQLSATIINYGSADAGDFMVHGQIADSTGAVVYRDSAYIAGPGAIPPGGASQVAFPSVLTPGNGRYTARVHTAMAGDLFPGNDTLLLPCRFRYFRYELGGQVLVDFMGLRPLQGAVICLEDSVYYYDEVGYDTSDADGGYGFEDVPHSTMNFQLLATKPKYYSYALAPVPIIPDCPNTIKFTMRPIIDLAAVSTPDTAILPSGQAFQPSLTIANNSPVKLSDFWCYCDIRDSSFDVIHSDSIGLLSPDSLDTSATRVIEFPSAFTPAPSCSYWGIFKAKQAGECVPQNDTLTVRFRTFPMVAGRVTDANAGTPFAGVSLMLANARDTFRTVTDSAGDYRFNTVPEESYSLLARMAGYNDSLLRSVPASLVRPFVADFSLGYPLIALTPPDTLSATVAAGATDSSVITMTNNGGAALEYNFRWQCGGPAKALGDSLWGLMVDPAVSSLCYGVEQVGQCYWVTHSGTSASSDPNYLVKLDASGAVLTSFQQPGGGTAGWQDLAWDGRYLYGSYASFIEQIDTATGMPTGVQIPSPANPARALAYNPLTDRFYVANQGSRIWEIDRWGAIVNEWPNTYSIRGLCFDADAPDGPWLWAWCLTASPRIRAYQFDVTAGAYVGVSFGGNVISPSAYPQGCGLTVDHATGKTAMLSLIRDTPNRLVSYELRDDDGQWLAFHPRGGSVAPGSGAAIRAVFNAAGLAPETNYDANVTIATNSRDTLIPYLVHLRTTGVGVAGTDKGQIASAFALHQNSPNPFKEISKIKYQISKMGNVSLAVYNVAGQRVKTLFDGYRGPGTYVSSWDGKDEAGRKAAAGVYLCRLMAEEKSVVGRMTLVR